MPLHSLNSSTLVWKLPLSFPPAHNVPRPRLLGTLVGSQVCPPPPPPPPLTSPRHYSLHVVQHPLRARMCGFGDKVSPRRVHLPTYLPSPRHRIAVPLHPLPLPRWSSAEKTTQLSTSSLSFLPPLFLPLTRIDSELDSSFFLVTVDLWSADGKREMNLVLHPSSSDRHVSTAPQKSRKHRGSVPSTASPRSDHPSPSTSSSTPSMAHDPRRSSLDSQVCITCSPKADGYRFAR